MGNFKKNITTILFVFFTFTVFSQSNFIINKFDVDIVLNKDGSFDVTEKIKLTFTQNQRGIIRQIPYKFGAYQNSKYKSKPKKNHPADYEIIIEEISVENFEYETSQQGRYYEIKIGSPDVYLVGEQTYTIKYTVWGALNLYENFTEFAWNITGDEWNVLIQEATYSVKLPQKATITTDSIAAMTGKGDFLDETATKHISNYKTIYGKTTKILDPNEGLKIFINLPSGIFDNVNIPIEKISQNGHITSVDYKFKINEDGSVDYTEKMEFNSNLESDAFTKNFPVYNTQDENYKDLIIQDLDVIVYNNDEIVNSGFNYEPTVNSKEIKTYTENKITGKTTLIYNAKIWGMIDFDNDIATFSWELNQFLGDKTPIENTSFTIITASEIKFSEDDFSVVELNTNTPTVFYQFNSENEITGNKVFSDTKTQQFEIYLSVSSDNFDKDEIPVEVDARDYYIDNFNTVMNINENGAVKIRHSFEVVFKNMAVDYSGDFNFAVKIQDKFKQYFYPGEGSLELEYPRWQVFGMYFYPLIYNITSSNDSFHKDKWKNKYLWTSKYTDTTDVVKFDYEYEIYSILKKEGKNYIFNFPIIPSLNEPIKYGTFTLFLPETSDEGFNSFEGYIIGKEQEREFLMLSKGLTISGEFNNLKSNDLPFVKIKFSKKYITKAAFGKKLKLIAKNNRSFIVLIIVFLVLSAIWYLFGRDKITEIKIIKSIPAGITPAEVGYIWDNKLHNRDLMALLIFWSSKGYMEIVETVKNKDYLLVRRTGLPNEATKFEKTIFFGIFPKGTDKVNLSTLKRKMYYKMRNAETEFKRYAKTKRFFTPGTIGFSSLLYVVATIFFIIAGFSFLGNLYHAQFQTAIMYFLSGLMLIFFSRIMPKFSTFGKEKYHEVLGLKKFIETVSLSELEKISEENPEIFGQVLPYSIVMGLHFQWANKFEAIPEITPKWYKMTTEEHFTPSEFVKSIISFMKKANQIFKIKPPSTSSSSGSYRKSSSSSNSYNRTSSFSRKTSSFSSKSSSSRSSRPKYGGGGGGKSW